VGMASRKNRGAVKTQVGRETLFRKNRDATPLRKVRFGDYVPKFGHYAPSEQGCYPTPQSTLRGPCPVRTGMLFHPATPYQSRL